MNNFVDLDKIVPPKTVLVLDGKEVFLDGKITTEQMLDMQKIETRMQELEEEEESGSESLQLVVYFVKQVLIDSNPGSTMEDFKLTIGQTYEVYKLIVKNAMVGVENAPDAPLPLEKEPQDHKKATGVKKQSAKK